MINYFERLAHDAYTLASKYAPLEEQQKIKNEEERVTSLAQNSARLRNYMVST